MDESHTPLHERIGDPSLRLAVHLLDAGEVEQLQQLILAEPGLLGARASFPDMGYFQEPTLLEFAAENPVRHGRAANRLLESVAILLSAGFDQNSAAMNGLLSLAASGRVVREAGVQAPLIALLCQRGADPNGAMPSALAHDEAEATDALLLAGAERSLIVCAALGDLDGLHREIDEASPECRHRALALAAQYGQAQTLNALILTGEDPSRLNPPGFHAHSTPLHQAACRNHQECALILIAAGADRSARDTVFGGTPADWARHAGHLALAETLA